MFNRRPYYTEARAVLDGVTWRDVPYYYWSSLTSLAGELSVSMLGVGVVDGEMVAFAGH